MQTKKPAISDMPLGDVARSDRTPPPKDRDRLTKSGRLKKVDVDKAVKKAEKRTK